MLQSTGVGSKDMTESFALKIGRQTWHYWEEVFSLSDTVYLAEVKGQDDTSRAKEYENLREYL